MKNIQIDSLINYKLRTPIIIEVIPGEHARASFHNVNVRGNSEEEAIINMKQELERIYVEYHESCLTPLDMAVLIELLNACVKESFFGRIKNIIKRLF